MILLVFYMQFYLFIIIIYLLFNINSVYDFNSLMLIYKRYSLQTFDIRTPCIYLYSD